MKVFVYFNLHKRCFSIKALEGDRKGKVIAHAEKVFLTDATFKVSQAGRERVLIERKKNVHAGVVGDWDMSTTYNRRNADLLQVTGVPVTYNPYKYRTFVSLYAQIPMHKARLVSLITDVSVTGERKGFIYSDADSLTL